MFLDLTFDYKTLTEFPAFYAPITSQEGAIILNTEMLSENNPVSYTHLEYKGREYTERWSYELARLYAKAGMKDKCVEECDDLILWFSEGKYVIKAMELKMKYAPLSPSQEEKYRNRYVEPSPESAAAAAAATITAATQAASKLVSQSVGTGIAEQNTDEMPHIESVRSRATGKAPEEVSVFSPILETTGVLQDKIAKGIRDVFSGGPKVEEDVYKRQVLQCYRGQSIYGAVRL